MQRIVIVGTTGSGKTTLAKQVSTRLHIPHIELDSLQWQPNWTYLPAEQLREKTIQVTTANTWVADGNYSRVRDIIWSRADTLIWLDYPFWVVFGRLARRTLKRIATREKLWGDNVENLRTAVFSQDSLLIWIFKTHWKRKREYPQLFAQPEYAHLQVIHLKSPVETAQWLDGLKVQ
jgi:adenylate kinase family enzyme